MTRREQERRLRIYSELCDGCAHGYPDDLNADNKAHYAPLRNVETHAPAGFGLYPCRAWAVRKLHEQFDREDETAVEK